LQISGADFVIGVFGARLGLPLNTGLTGAEHEIRQAYESWQNKGKPNVLLYFKVLDKNALEN
jgi:hypothetical protein